MGWALVAAEPHHRKGWLKRFDPRFWTIDFARPMMASVTSDTPGTLRAETVFYRKHDLAGLIWEAEDRWDHPLLAYETKRDFRHVQLSFQWRSSGVKPLDALHGPTLTIEGRDAAGNPRAWYVRLWNYASGTGEDALVRLDFDALDGGFLLPGEADPVWAELLEQGVWRLSRLLRGRAGTASDAHAAGEPFVMLDDPALSILPEALAPMAENDGATLQWVPRGGTVLTEVAVPAAARALKPLSPVRGRVRRDGTGGVIVEWVRRSRVDTGWRDHVDLALGESREAWRAALSPPVPGVGPWETALPTLSIAAADLAMLPAGCAISIRQLGDFALSEPLLLPLPLAEED